MVGSIGGGFNPSNISQMRQQALKKMDANGDSKIDASELEAMGKQQGGPSGINFKDLMKKIDSNDDGSIDETESNTFMSKMEEKMKTFSSNISTYGEKGEKRLSSEGIGEFLNSLI